VVVVVVGSRGHARHNTSGIAHQGESQRHKAGQSLKEIPQATKEGQVVIYLMHSLAGKPATCV